MAYILDTAQMAQVAGELNAGSTEIRTQVARLKGSVDGLVAAGFKGGAGAANFDSLYANWDVTARQLFETLEQIAQALNQTAADVDAQDAQLGSRFAGGQ